MVCSFLTLSSCVFSQKEHSIKYNSVDLISDSNDSVTTILNFPRDTNISNQESTFYEIGFNDGYIDGDHLEKGKSYKNNIPEEWKSIYRKAYFEGYAEGRAVSDYTDDYFTGNNNTDYYDLSDDIYEGDEDDWSDEDD